GVNIFSFDGTVTTGVHVYDTPLAGSTAGAENANSTFFKRWTQGAIDTSNGGLIIPAMIDADAVRATQPRIANVINPVTQNLEPYVIFGAGFSSDDDAAFDGVDDNLTSIIGGSNNARYFFIEGIDNDADAFGLSSQERAIRAWEEDRFAGQYITIEAPDADEDGNLLETTHTVARDEGLRETSLEKLANLKPVARENGVHTAGNASQISDGAAAVLIMTAAKADALGLTPRARIVDTCLVGVDPEFMLTGPIDATQKLLARTGLSIDDIDLFEINEAFASVVLAWAKEVGADLDKTNPNGGAIALGHPLGGTGAFLLTKALYELERSEGQYGLVSMCCGGGLGTGTIIERL
ncbi:MAG: acetyl-CoA C-acyltransferase, partial [Actinomycetota bacterium]